MTGNGPDARPLWMRAALAGADSALVQTLVCLLLGVFVGLNATTLSLLLLLLAAAALALGGCLLQTNWIITLLIFFSSFHFVIKLIPSGLTDVWREMLFILILVAWLVQVLAGKVPLPRISLVNILVAGYLLYGFVAILNSFNLLVGLAGFRFMFSFVPLFFVVSSTVVSERDVKRFMVAILASGVIMSVIAVLQFIMIELLGWVDPGTWLDPTQEFSGGAGAEGVEWLRSSSLLIGPGELGVLLAACLILTAGYYFSPARRRRHPRLLLLMMVLLVLGLLASMSRSNIIGVVVAFLALGFVKRRVGPIVTAIGGGMLILVIALIYVAPIVRGAYTGSDPYFAYTSKVYLAMKVSWRTLLIGQGYGLTGSAAEKLGLKDTPVLMLGGIDMPLMQLILQVGVIGTALFYLSWLSFVRNAYRVATRLGNTRFLRDTAAGIFAAFIGIIVASAHTAAWDYVSFAASYYLLGAVASWAVGGAGASNGDPQAESESDVTSPIALAESSSS